MTPPSARPTVTIDQVEGARIATRHLLDLGHRTVHHVAGPQTWIDATARMRGWSDALRDVPRSAEAAPWPATGVPPRATRPACASPATRTSTAIFAANDQTALGVIRGLHDAGRRVPEDVSVVGFDDTPESGYFLPPLTTVRQDFGEVGRRSVELLLSLADGELVERHVVVPAELVERASTAPRRRSINGSAHPRRPTRPRSQTTTTVPPQPPPLERAP